MDRRLCAPASTGDPAHLFSEQSGDPVEDSHELTRVQHPPDDESHEGDGQCHQTPNGVLTVRREIPDGKEGDDDGSGDPAEQPCESHSAS